jgi:hypothetical protein
VKGTGKKSCGRRLAPAGSRVGGGAGSQETELVSHPVFKIKSNAHSMCAQQSSLHTYRTENRDRITNVSI